MRRHSLSLPTMARVRAYPNYRYTLSNAFCFYFPEAPLEKVLSVSRDLRNIAVRAVLDLKTLIVPCTRQIRSSCTRQGRRSSRQQRILSCGRKSFHITDTSDFSNVDPIGTSS